MQKGTVSVLYLAEVQKKSGFMVGPKAELKLLIRQQSEQNWQAVPGEEIIPADAANDYNAGALVLVELNSNRQIQNIQDAGKQLVNILQNFSRLREKFRTQEEEIEGWKQSLIYQSQELTRRELEMEMRQEELHELEEQFQRLERERQEIEANRAQVQQLQEQLQQQQHQLEERQAAGGAELDPQQRQRVEQILNGLEQAIAEGEVSQAQFHRAIELLEQQQALLNQSWQTLEQSRQIAHQRQAELDGQIGHLEQGWREWHQAEAAQEPLRLDLKLQEQTLNLKLEQLQMLTLVIQADQEVAQQFYAQAGLQGLAEGDGKVDLRALEAMPLEELNQIVENLQRDLEKMVSFVNDQEEELALQQQAVEALREKLKHASEYECLSLTSDLEYEQQSYQLLNDTLEGQRQVLLERREVLRRHEAVLQKRQGIQEQSPGQVDLEQLAHLLELQGQSRRQELQNLEQQIAQLRGTIQQLQNTLDSQSANQTGRYEQLKQQDSDLLQQRTQVAQLWGRVNTLQETLQPLQDSLNELRQQLMASLEGLSQRQPGQQAQKQMAAELKALLLATA